MVIKPAWCQLFTPDCRNEPATGFSGNRDLTRWA